MCGLIPTPTLVRHSIEATDHFLIMASDGVWEFIQSSEAVRIVDKAYRAGKTAREASYSLITRAALRWAQEEGSYRDDITAVVVYLAATVQALARAQPPDIM